MQIAPYTSQKDITGCMSDEVENARKVGFEAPITASPSSIKQLAESMPTSTNVLPSYLAASRRGIIFNGTDPSLGIQARLALGTGTQVPSGPLPSSTGTGPGGPSSSPPYNTDLSTGSRVGIAVGTTIGVGLLILWSVTSVPIFEKDVLTQHAGLCLSSERSAGLAGPKGRRDSRCSTCCRDYQNTERFCPKGKLKGHPGGLLRNGLTGRKHGARQSIKGIVSTLLLDARTTSAQRLG